MTRNSFYLLLVLTVGFGLVNIDKVSAYACNRLSPSVTIPSGFGASFNLFSTAREMMVSGNCENAADVTVGTITVGNGNALTYTYNRGYHYNGTSWTPYTLNCNGVTVSGVWCVGSGVTSINLTQNITNVLGYTCQYISNAWKCGCRDNACTTSYWQLQQLERNNTNPPPPPPPGGGGGGGTGDRFNVSPSTTTFNCATQNVGAGDVIVIPGGTRGPLTILNCVGSANNHIFVRNDTTSNGPAIIRRSSGAGGGFIFVCENCRYVTIDGTGKWNGASSLGCGALDIGSGRPPAIRNCGIKVTPSTSGNDSPSSFLALKGNSRFVTLRGVEVDGNWPTGNGTNGNGLVVNDHSYNLPNGVTQASPTEWREGVVLTDNYVHETQGEGIYFGGNFSSEAYDDLPLRNNEMSYNIVRDAGYDCVSMKSSIAGTSRIHHNWVSGCGLTHDDASTGNSGACIDNFEGAFTQIYNNYAENCYGPGFVANTQNRPASYGPMPISVYSNTFVRPGTPSNNKPCIVISRRDTTNAEIEPNIYNNTCTDPDGIAIRVDASISPCTIRDNILNGEGTHDDISAPSCTVTNN